MNDRRAKRLGIRLVLKSRRGNAHQVCVTCGTIAASLSFTKVKRTFGQWLGVCDVCGDSGRCGAARDFGYPDFRKVPVAEAWRINALLDAPLENGEEAWIFEIAKYPVTLCH